MFERCFVPAFAVLCSLVFAAGAFFTLLTVVLTTGVHCTSRDTTTITCLATMIALIGGAVVMQRLKHRPHAGRFFLALLIPLIAVGTHAAAMTAQTDAEIACRQSKDALSR